MNSICKHNHSLVNLFFIIFLSWLGTGNVPVVNGQYESPNDLCGGVFHSTNGSIRFNYTSDQPPLQEHVCAWTLNLGHLTQRTGYTIRVQKLESLACASDNRLTISHFNHRSKEVTASETWSCGGPQQWVNVPGTVIVVVLYSKTLPTNTGFLLEWSESGTYMNRTGLRTMYYSWGKHSVEPMPYFAAGFMRNEISTFAFSKGNNTKGYKLEMSFDTIKMCPNAGLDTCPGNAIVAFGIQIDGSLEVLEIYEDEMVDTPEISSVGGLFILVWIEDYWGAGASFELKYQSVRE